MVSIPMTPCQFAKVNEIIAKDHPEAKVTEDSTTFGHIHTSQIDANYEYFPEANGGTLVFKDEVKHGLYNLVSDDTIGAHLGALLSGIVCDEVETSVVEVETPSTPVDGQAGASTEVAPETPTA